ncbi:protein of unknown function [Maridesulfovibrio hydrothermalis AM13 = DSM 14728]|uniref:Uncharacterized protein n=1 Tax=Maridesulfovibrio hydrothermalis AM13 = DSM 14728 TaxID=1121451 RepID=L0RGG0_9BACT|nr:protein of unknown function [Maridesulfovibrio hydrothermalis AM13 = DSM 14728]
MDALEQATYGPARAEFSPLPGRATGN